MLPFTPEWRAARQRRERARKYVATLMREPEPGDVDWLAEAAAAGDRDHARWELRYARMAIGVFVAERDALADQVASDVSAALQEALDQDPTVAPDMKPLARRQIDDRLQAYRDAFFAGGAATGANDRVGRVLLAFASDGARSAGRPLARATEVLGAIAFEANAALQDAFGAASLPEHLPPSEAAGRR